MRIGLSLVIGGCVLLCCIAGRVAASDALIEAAPTLPTPPGQREAGPGGSDYAYDRMRIQRYGEGADRVWVFWPEGAGDRPMPVVLFVHGMNLETYGPYRLWIEHLVRRGNIVIYPRYQAGSITDPRTFTESAARATRLALNKLDGERLPKADTGRFAMVGHSLGGIILMNLAARPRHYGLPVPKALMPVQPGDVRSHRGLGALFPQAREDHATVAEGALLLVVATVGDRYVGRRFAYEIYQNTTLIDEADKDVLIVSADTHGRPAPRADHFMPLASIDRRGKRRADAYDFALWRWFDALCDTAYGSGEYRAVALGNTSAQRDLGKWSDGTPIHPPIVLDPRPDALPGELPGGLPDAVDAE